MGKNRTSPLDVTRNDIKFIDQDSPFEKIISLYSVLLHIERALTSAFSGFLIVNLSFGLPQVFMEHHFTLFSWCLHVQETGGPKRNVN